MPRFHHRSSWPSDEPIAQSEHQLLMDWERRIGVTIPRAPETATAT